MVWKGEVCSELSRMATGQARVWQRLRWHQLCSDISVSGELGQQLVATA